MKRFLALIVLFPIALYAFDWPHYFVTTGCSISEAESNAKKELASFQKACETAGGGFYYAYGQKTWTETGFVGCPNEVSWMVTVNCGSMAHGN